jgi:DNA-binding transcriptional LysR family regulator
VELRRLRHALALRQERNFVKAAAALHITQPALSQSILELERELGVRLFDRDRNGAVLTTAGQAFMSHAEQVLQSARGLEREMALIRDGAGGSLAFGLGPVPAACFLQRILTRFVEERPGFTVQVEVNNGDALREHLFAERIEFFVASRQYVADDSRLSTRPLQKLPCSVFGRAKHPLAKKRKAPTAAQVQEYPKLSVRGPESGPELWSDILGVDSKTPLPGTIYCDDFAILKSLVLSSDALVLAPVAAVAGELAAGSIVELRPSNMRKLAADLMFTYIRNRTLSAGAEIAFNTIRELTNVQPAGRDSQSLL